MIRDQSLEILAAAAVVDYQGQDDTGRKERLTDAGFIERSGFSVDKRNCKLFY